MIEKEIVTFSEAFKHNDNVEKMQRFFAFLQECKCLP